MPRNNVPSITVALLLSLSGGEACAGSMPLDFSYRVTGSPELRPVAVFNDGQDTFIQPQNPDEKGVMVNGAVPVRSGPYFILKGLSKEIITLSVGKKQVIQISYLGATTNLPKAAVAQPVAAKTKVAEESVSARPSQGSKLEQPKLPVCTPKRQSRDAGFVVAFSGKSLLLSDKARNDLIIAIAGIRDASGVEVIAEANDKGNAQKRAESIKQAIVAAGVKDSIIEISGRKPSLIGSEVHVHQVVDIPCGSRVLKFKSRLEPVTVLWDGEGKVLADMLAKSLGVPLKITGTPRQLDVVVGAVDVAFPEAMDRIGQAFGVSADLILRRTELVLNFKDKP